MKIALLIGGASYFGLGLYYTLSATSFTDGKDPELEKKIRNFLFLFAFAGFDFYLESLALMDDIDGSTHCKSIYHLQCPHENIAILLKSTAKAEISKGKDQKRE